MRGLVQMNMAVWGLNQPPPMYAPNFAPGTLICFFTSQYLSKTKILPLRNNKKYMCNMSQVAPILLTYLADFGDPSETEEK